MHVAMRPRHGPLARRHCAVLRTSGFVDEVTFAQRRPGKGDPVRLMLKVTDHGQR